MGIITEFKSVFLGYLGMITLPSKIGCIPVLWILLQSCFFLDGCGPVHPSYVDDQGRKGVVFTYTGECESVCIGGDFNSWSSESHCLVREGDKWIIELYLAPGGYRYGYIIDGKEWKPDPKALLHEIDGFGKTNSIIIVE